MVASIELESPASKDVSFSQRRKTNGRLNMLLPLRATRPSFRPTHLPLFYFPKSSVFSAGDFCPPLSPFTRNLIL